MPILIRSEYQQTLNPGSGITLWATFEEQVLVGADALGEKGIRAESVGEDAAKALMKAIDSKAPVDSHLADQLIPFMGLLPGSSIKTEKTRLTSVSFFFKDMFFCISFNSTMRSVLILSLTSSSHLFEAMVFLRWEYLKIKAESNSTCFITSTVSSNSSSVSVMPFGYHAMNYFQLRNLTL